MRKVWSFIAAAAMLVSAAPAPADVWDVATGTDDVPASTDNELIHGSEQVHDLGVRPGGVPDVDWYRIGQQPYSSYEIIVDGTAGDVAVPATGLLRRVDVDQDIVLQTAETYSPLGASRSLRFANTTGDEILNQFIRVGPGGCGAACTAEDQYRIRAIETTILVSRFNNANGQVTILLAQNASDLPVTATVFSWSPAGVLLDSAPITLQPKELKVVNLAARAALAGQAGSITIAHDAPYAQLNVKTVALDPEHGFSFDTPGVYRGL